MCIQKKVEYSNEAIDPPTPYYDYVLLLGSLVLVSIQGYIQFQYDWFNGVLALNSIISAIILIYLAFRFDHIGILSLGIVAFISAFGIQISPKNWEELELYNSAYYYNIGVIMGLMLSGIGLYLYFKSVKKHFLFTFMNFGVLLFLFSTMSGMFADDNYGWIFIILQIVGLVAIYTYAMWQKSFLYLLYGFLFGYITLTYLVILMKIEEPFFWFFYMIASCGGLIMFIIYSKKHLNG